MLLSLKAILAAMAAYALITIAMNGVVTYDAVSNTVFVPRQQMEQARINVDMAIDRALAENARQCRMLKRDLGIDC